MSLQDQLREHLRLAIVETLYAAPGYALHEYLLLDRVRALGLGTSRDMLRGEIAWLKEQGLVSIPDTIEGAYVPRLEDRGADVAQDLARVPGIARARP